MTKLKLGALDNDKPVIEPNQVDLADDRAIHCGGSGAHDGNAHRCNSAWGGSYRKIRITLPEHSKKRFQGWVALA
jgi:hypothetical protein